MSKRLFVFLRATRKEIQSLELVKQTFNQNNQLDLTWSLLRREQYWDQKPQQSTLIDSTISLKIYSFRLKIQKDDKGTANYRKLYTPMDRQRKKIIETRRQSCNFPSFRAKNDIIISFLLNSCYYFYQQVIQMLSKPKKQQNQRTFNQKRQKQLKTQQSSSKNSLAITTRKAQAKNRENHIQITEPLDFVGLVSQSKQFVLSRESFFTDSRSNLKDMSNSNRFLNNKHTRQVADKNNKDREMQIFDRRLSLKCTGSTQKPKQSQKSHRLSMAPLRRQSFASQLKVSIHPFEKREIADSLYTNSIEQSQSKQLQSFKKQAIITNLMNKLGHEESLRSIIELKLKSGSTSTQLSTQKRNQSYATDITQESSNMSIATKLKQCETSISYFKQIIKQMASKIKQLTQERDFGKKNAYHLTDSAKTPGSINNPYIGFLKKANDDICSRCKTCKCNQKQDFLIIKGVQNAKKSAKQHEKNEENDESLDFLDNLESTLKVLESKNS